VLCADDEKEILGLGPELDHVSTCKVASARRLGDCASGLISKPVLNASRSRPTPRAALRRRVPETKVKVTLKLEQTRWRALRIQALREGRSASEIINELMAAYLKRKGM